MRIIRRSVLVLITIALAAAGHLSARQIGSRPAEDWIAQLERPKRVADLRIDQVIPHLALKEGDVVVDVGTGAGAFVPALSRAVGAKGKVYAEDIEQGLVDYVAKKAQAEKLANVQAVLGKPNDPSLPAKDVDLGFIHDVLHHVQEPKVFLKTLGSYIKPNGRIALIDIDPNGPSTSHAEDPEILLHKAEVRKWMADAGFPSSQEFQVYPDKYFIIYSRDAKAPASAAR
jgi:ubiquinone/menaquinone biosynthesis C-methylase UbiE